MTDTPGSPACCSSSESAIAIEGEKLGESLEEGGANAKKRRRRDKRDALLDFSQTTRERRREASRCLLGENPVGGCVLTAPGRREDRLALCLSLSLFFFVAVLLLLFPSCSSSSLFLLFVFSLPRVQMETFAHRKRKVAVWAFSFLSDSSERKKDEE